MNRSGRGGGGVKCNGPGPRQLVSEIIVGREAVKVFFVCAARDERGIIMPWRMDHGVPWRILRADGCARG